MVTVLTSALVGGCSAGESSTVSKEEARARAKADDIHDYCAEYGWYNDGICDDFCLERDPDCSTDARTPELGDDPAVALASQMMMSDGLAFSEENHGPTIEAKFEIDHDGELALSVYPAGAGIGPDAEHNVFEELAGDPTASKWDPELAVFHDQEHLTRSARDVTLVQLSKYTLAEAVDWAEEYGFVYWAIPTIQDGRAGYGIYVLVADEDGDEVTSVYRFVDGGGSHKRGLIDLGDGPGDGATDPRTPELGDDVTVVRQSSISMSQALKKVFNEYGPAIEAKFELDHDGKLSLSIYPVSEDISVDSERQRFFELAGDPTGLNYEPVLSEFTVPDEEHLTRSSRDLTLVQTANLTLLQAVKKAESAFPGGFVYWAIPTRRETRAGYGIYVLDASDQVHYLFVF